MDSRVVAIVAELDRTVPVERAAVIAYVDAFWQTWPKVEKQEHHAYLLATPRGFVRLGIEFLKAAVSPPIAGAHGNDVMPDLDYLLRSDSNLDIECERVTAIPLLTRSNHERPPAFDWQDGVDSGAPAWLRRLKDLDDLVPPAREEVLITVPEGRYGVVVVLRATEDGLLRLGLEFAKAGIMSSSRSGRNRGELVDVDLTRLLDSRSDLEFDCERIDVLPENGDRRRSRGVHGHFPFAVPLAVTLVLIARACLR